MAHEYFLYVFSSTGKLVYKKYLRVTSKYYSVAQGDKQFLLGGEMRFFVIHLNGK
jgi:hypothetical protein